MIEWRWSDGMMTLSVVSAKTEGIGGPDINYEILATTQDIGRCTQFQGVEKKFKIDLV